MTNYTQQFEVKDLPSGKIQYPEATRINIYPFTFGDILKFNQSTMSVSEFYDFILEGVNVSGMDKYDLTFYDTVYLGWFRKVASLGSSILEIKSYCPNCEYKNGKALDITELDFSDTTIKKLPAKTKICNIELHFQYLTIGQYLELVSLNKTDLTSLFSKCVSNVSFQEAYDVINSATGKDLEKIDYLNKILYHGVSDLDFKCTECSHEFKVQPTDSSEVELMKPFRREEFDVRDEISFG